MTLRSEAMQAAEYVRNDLARSSLAFRAWMAFLVALLLLGAYGALRTLPPGAETFGTTPAFEWSILIAAYVFFVVTTSGLCLVSSLGHVFGIERFKPVAKRALVLALIFLFAGFGVIALDLHYPDRLVFGVVLSPSPHSAMWWMGTLYSIYMVFLLVELYGVVRNDHRIAKLGASLAVVTAVAAPSTLGGVFGVLVARPFWHGSFVPLYLVLSALVSGTAVLGIAFYLVHKLRLRGAGPQTTDVISGLGMLLALFLGVTMFFTVWQTLVALYGGVPGQAEATKALLTGPLAWEFWIFKVLIGIVVPFAILVRTGGREPRAVFWASCLAFGGIFMDRMVFLAAGQIAPATLASGIVSATWAQYAPSFVEVSIILGAIGFTGLAYTLAERYFPFQEAGRAWAPVAAVALEPAIIRRVRLAVRAPWRPALGGSPVLAFEPGVMRRARLAPRVPWRPALGGTFVLAAVGSAVLLAAGQFPSTTVVSAPLATATQTMTPTQTPVTSATPSAGQPAQMPVHGDCRACHEESGQIVRVKQIPPVAHPIEGWTSCTACHQDAGLVPQDAGHTGITEADCLLCHRSSLGQAPERPHNKPTGLACTDCHGSRSALPPDHAGRTYATCWLCHRQADVHAPDKPHPTVAGAACRDCHTEGKVGALPADHAARTEPYCTLCHQSQAAGPSPLPHSITLHPSYCVFCHTERPAGR